MKIYMDADYLIMIMIGVPVLVYVFLVIIGEKIKQYLRKKKGK